MRLTHVRNNFTKVSSLLVCGLLAGVVVAAAAFPAAALSGLAAKAGETSFASLPSELKDFSSPQVTRVYAADNRTLLAQFHDEFRSDVPIKDISKNMQAAIIAAEDRKFYQHNGVDLKGVARAFVSNNQGGSQQGASTLTMQYVRMALAYSATNPQEVIDATKDTPTRKLTEMKYALQIEKDLTKEQILERYLNIAPFGNQAYGIYAASQVYFNKTPSKLDVAEAAMLAGMVKAPTSFNPTIKTGHDQIQARRDNYILPGMVAMGAITQADADKAKTEKIPTKVKAIANGCISVAKNNWGFFCDYFYRWWMEQDAFGATTYDRERRLKSGGYRVVTTLDVKGQNAARAEIAERQSDSSQNALLLAGVEPGTGKVRILATNRTYGLDDPAHPKNKLSPDPAKKAKNIRGSFPKTTNPLITGGGDITGYQAGSVYKAFTMVAALEKGFPLSYPINSPATFHSQYKTSPSDESACPGSDDWCPSNASKSEAGVFNMWTGFGKSVNTYFVPLEQKVGAENVVDVAKRFGVKFRVPKEAEMANDEDQAAGWGSFTLGVMNSTPLDMANAYATLAGDGMYCDPTPITQITTEDGAKIDVGKPHCKQATSKDVARAALDAARCPVGDSAQLGSCNGQNTAGDTRGIVGHPVFGKTGTTDAEKTASLIVGTTSLVVAGYMANPDWQNHRDHMSHDVINDAVQHTLADFMKGKPSVQFKKPGNDKMSTGDLRSVPDVTCDSMSSAKDKISGAGFDPVTGPAVDSDCPAGTAAGTSEDRTVKGGAVTIEVSNGKKNQPQQPDPQNPDPGQSTPGHN
ncbi:transglycosylase domain-containing protein [Actinoplanes cyaneus]|uniref:transglycosylase domain-containing protein n=1 Tax=Actinoplanes cyaneus TaxID=52696 RepID=UPI001944BE6B|nr:Membrane carboxypeptidase (penicillin-binding protein) [Actinoplanes cyaneus]